MNLLKRVEELEEVRELKTEVAKHKIDAEEISIGYKIRYYRRKKGITQEQLSKMANISRSYLATIETNKNKPSYKTIETIAKVLEIETDLITKER